MKRYKNFFPENFKLVFILFAILLGAGFLGSCSSDELKIQKGAPFEVIVMPVPKEITNGQTIEMRFTLQRTDQYTDTKYYIRYFQYNGQGLLKFHNKRVLLPNDLYLLTVIPFRLYYTSTSTVSQSFEIWISDNLGNEKHLSFQFNSSD